MGRYGLDGLGNFLSTAAFVSLILFRITGRAGFYVLGSLGLAYALYRMMSKNHGKRVAENRWYCEKTNGIRKKLWKTQTRIRDRKTHHIYTCPNCSQKIRIPKGRGEIEITCPTCRAKFRRKS